MPFFGSFGWSGEGSDGSDRSAFTTSSAAEAAEAKKQQEQHYHNKVYIGVILGSWKIKRKLLFRARRQPASSSTTCVTQSPSESHSLWATSGELQQRMMAWRNDRRDGGPVEPRNQEKDVLLEFRV